MLLYIGRFCFSLILVVCVCVCAMFPDIYLFDLLDDYYAWRVPFNELQTIGVASEREMNVCMRSRTHM